MLQMDNSRKETRAQFSPAGNGLFCVAWITDFPLLDDCWTDQCRLHLRGPSKDRSSFGMTLLVLTIMSFFLKGQVVGTFCGGRALRIRLPVQPSLASDGHDKSTDSAD